MSDGPPLARGAETNFLIDLVRAQFVAAPTPAPPPSFDWEAFLSVAQCNRLLLPAVQGLAVPDSARETIERYRKLTLQLNAAALMTTRRIVPVLENAGVDVVVIKGPLAQHARYGDYFVKPATDVDLLVHPRDFARARAIIVASGFALAAPCDKIWWRGFLGEQHLIGNAAGQAAIDLHHRTQQPGCPPPHRPRQLLDQAVRTHIGNSPISTLSGPHACLLSCMSAAKALVHREPAGGHVLDIAMSLRSGEDLSAVFAAAAGLELTQTLQFGLRAAKLVVGGYAGPAPSLPWLSDVDLATLILDPAALTAPPTRTRLLLGLSDNSAIFLRELGRKAAAEGARILGV